MVRDVLLGFLTYVLSIAALIGMMILCHYLFGPPVSDRYRSFAFNGGGGMLLLAVVLILLAGVAAFSDDWGKF